MTLPQPQRAIGRGLAEIFASAPRDFHGLREIPLDLVQANPRQPRRDFDAEALVALAESIKARGILQPIVVRPLPGGAYELVAGERRLRAAKLAGREAIPAVVRETSEGERLELALIENMAREDLNPVEEARACATLVDDLGVTKEELGRRVGKSRVAVSNLIRLLELPDDALAMIEAGELSEGHGRAILTCKDHSWRRQLARDARTGGWSVRETERRAKEVELAIAGGEAVAAREAVTLHPDLGEGLAAAEDALSAALGREVQVRVRGDRCRVQFFIDAPADGIELAERLLSRTIA